MLPFNARSDHAFGVEWELQLVDTGTLDLADGIVPLMQCCPETPDIKPEFIRHSVEVSTPPCRTAGELASHLTALAAMTAERARGLGMRLAGAGTHPFCIRPAEITPTRHYRAIEARAGYLAQSHIVYATHVHVAMGSGDEAVRVMTRMLPYVPLLLALSANSPFWRAHDTGFASYRHRVLAARGSYGLPPDLEDWHEFEVLFKGAQRAGVFERLKDIHWDLRPRPDLGTLEVRIMDAQSTVRRTAALGALVRALAVYLGRWQSPQDGPLLAAPPRWLQRENAYRASRDGMEAHCVETKFGDFRPMGRLARQTLDAVAGTARELGDAAYLEALGTNLREGAGYLRQREVYARTGDLARVVQTLADDLDGELGTRSAAA